jgi:hypothetical protein
MLDGGCISFPKLGPLLIRIIYDFKNLMEWKVRMLALAQTPLTICWLSLMIDTGLLLALIEDLLSVA